MTAVLKIRGVPYSTFAEVEDAVKKLAADIELLPPDSDELDAMARHVGELLESLPDDRAAELLAYVTALRSTDPPSVDASPADVAPDGGDIPAVTEPLESPPLCPMCLGHGVLEVEPPQDPTAQRCPACEGYGKVYTGSRVEGNMTRDCPTCNGGGFVDVQPTIPLPPPLVRAAAAPAWPEAKWDGITQRWLEPLPVNLPWEGANWDGLEGTYK